jgi:tryptophanyl-tRNA synthetase
MKPVVISGFKPSGRLQIGNYLGAIKPALLLQETGKYDCLYFVADYHALTQKYRPAEKREEIMEMIASLLALGLNPKKSIFFLQSYVPEHANLAWLFNTITPVGKLQGMIEYREKILEGQLPNAGLLDYPVLMAADILLYKANLVPVGEDQRQHLELSREIARTFNDRFGRTFPEPVGLYMEGLRIKSLTNPEKKMSKSLPDGCLFLNDPPEEIRRKIKTAVTDSGKEISYDPKKKPGLSNLLFIFGEFSGRKVSELVKDYRGKTYSQFKEDLTEMLISSLAPIREKIDYYLKNRELVSEIISSGSEQAGDIASTNFKEIRDKVGLL